MISHGHREKQINFVHRKRSSNFIYPYIVHRGRWGGGGEEGGRGGLYHGLCTLRRKNMTSKPDKTFFPKLAW